MNAIVADDSMVARSIVRRVITAAGYHAIEAAHGGQVIEILEENSQPIALILMDWNMPTLDGFDALVKIRGDNRFASIPVIMLTSESDEKKINAAYDAGADGYLEKPFTPEELIAEINRTLKK